MTQKPDAELIKSARRGDPDSFTQLCSRYYTAMVAIAHAKLGDRHLAEDAAQEAFAKACEKLGQLKNENKFAYWLAAICRNTANDIVSRKEKFSTTDDLSMIADKIPDFDLAETVRDAVNKLSEPAKELVFLKYYDGMSYEQISKVLGLSKQTINGRLRRAKKKIEKYLRHNGFVGMKT